MQYLRIEFALHKLIYLHIRDDLIKLIIVHEYLCTSSKIECESTKQHGAVSLKNYTAKNLRTDAMCIYCASNTRRKPY